ncbi:hypothetical protein [Massilia sp. TS11]|uniref:hypothetical protein n=1 Tax=Massilia sp. TS11 TaxID=2908003 RepID=UPI001EDC6DF7|nr:hypothetical protein [Massilia sp. TS11]MCG2586450.1 hypothetical protein [Massilia sp. TS11]
MDQLRFAISERQSGLDEGQSALPFALLLEFQRDVADFLKGSSRELDLAQVALQLDQDGGALVLHCAGLGPAASLWSDLAFLASPDTLHLIDARRAAVLERWQAAVKQQPQRRYAIDDGSGAARLRVDARTHLSKTDDVWVYVDKYLHGRIIDIGGKNKANIHLELEGGGLLTVHASHEALARDEQNRLYRPALLHVSAEENLITGELRQVRLLAFASHQPAFDEAEFERMVARGTAAWQGIGKAADWVDQLRGAQA